MAAARNAEGKGIRRLLNFRKELEPQQPLINPSPAAPGPTRDKTTKKGFSALRGLGCASSASQALMPEAAAAAAVRSSADWQGRRRPSRRRMGKKKPDRAHADVTDLWCAPGVVFGADASVDCVVAHQRRERPPPQTHRERPCVVRHGGNEELLSSLLDFHSAMEARDSELEHQLRSRQLLYMRGRHRRSPAGSDEMMLQTRVLLGGMDVQDQYRDMRLDVDNMTYEELLELGEKIGYVSTGLREEDILHNLRKPKRSLFGASPSQKEWKCIICQEEYEENDDMGRLECGHSYHTYCIKQWLLRKNTCPVCKTALAKR